MFLRFIKKTSLHIYTWQMEYVQLPVVSDYQSCWIIFGYSYVGLCPVTVTSMSDYVQLPVMLDYVWLPDITDNMYVRLPVMSEYVWLPVMSEYVWLPVKLDYVRLPVTGMSDYVWLQFCQNMSSYQLCLQKTYMRKKNCINFMRLQAP